MIHFSKIYLFLVALLSMECSLSMEKILEIPPQLSREEEMKLLTFKGGLAKIRSSWGGWGSWISEFEINSIRRGAHPTIDSFSIVWSEKKWPWICFSPKYQCSDVLKKECTLENIDIINCSSSGFSQVDPEKNKNAAQFLEILYRNHLISDCILDIVFKEFDSVSYPCLDFRLTPEGFALKIAEKAQNLQNYTQIKSLILSELKNDPSDSLRYQSYLWAVIEGLSNTEEMTDSLQELIVDLCQGITLKNEPFYAKSQLLIADYERANSDISSQDKILLTQKKYLKDLLRLSTFGLKESTLMEGTIKVILSGNQLKPLDLPEEMKNPQVSEEYILSLILYIKKLKEENEALKRNK